jgi:hypothetical protein
MDHLMRSLDQLFMDQPFIEFFFKAVPLKKNIIQKGGSIFFCIEDFYAVAAYY